MNKMSAKILKMQPNVSINHDGIFILKVKDFCNTCVHFQWKKTNASRHIGILSALRMRCVCVVCKRQLLAKLRIAVARISLLFTRSSLVKISLYIILTEVADEWANEIFNQSALTFDIEV